MLSGCFSPGADIVGSSSSGTTGMTGTTGTTGTTGAATEAVTDTTTAPTSSDTTTTAGTTTAGETTAGETTAGETTAGDTTTGDTTTGGTSTTDGSAGMTTEVGTTGPEVLCGDLILDPGEECDDGDIVDGDGCSKECKLEYRYVFVTSGVYTGSAPGGLMFYDGKCKTLAAGKDSLVNRTFVAWMSSAADSAKKRIGSSSLPYLLTDGVTKVADDTQDLLDGDLDAPIERDEENQPVFGTPYVWTGTFVDGTAAQLNCEDWSIVINSTGITGDAKKKDGAWTNSPVVDKNCSNKRHIYCIEKPM